MYEQPTLDISMPYQGEPLFDNKIIAHNCVGDLGDFIPTLKQEVADPAEEYEMDCTEQFWESVIPSELTEGCFSSFCVTPDFKLAWRQVNNVSGSIEIFVYHGSVDDVLALLESVRHAFGDHAEYEVQYV